MSVDCFLDTNVLVYAISSTDEEAAKKTRALDLIQNEDFGLSAQVLQEFYVTVTRKIRKPLTPEQAMGLMDEYSVFPAVATDYALIVSAVEISLRYGIAYWDGGRDARPVLDARGNAVYRTGACGLSLARSAEGPPGPGAFVGNAVVASGQDPRYDGDEPYCLQRAIARHAVPAGFAVAGNVLGANREPGDTRGRDDLPGRVFERRLRPLCRRFSTDPLLARTDFVREVCATR